MTKHLEDALDALETFSELGLSLTPSNPNDYMCHIGARAGNVDLKTAQRIYRFMVDAAMDQYLNPESQACRPDISFKS